MHTDAQNAVSQRTMHWTLCRKFVDVRQLLFYPRWSNHESGWMLRDHYGIGAF